MIALAQLPDPWSQAVSSLKVPDETVPTGMNWYPFSGACTTVLLRSVSCASVEPTGGYRPCKNPRVEGIKTLSSGEEAVIWVSLTMSGAMPWIWAGEPLAI